MTPKNLIAVSESVPIAIRTQSELYSRPMSTVHQEIGHRRQTAGVFH